MAEQEAEHSFDMERNGDGTAHALCSCGWRSRRVKGLDGPSNAWMRHIDREMPRARP